MSLIKNFQEKIQAASNKLNEDVKKIDQQYDLRLINNSNIRSSVDALKINDINSEYTTYNFPLQNNEIALYYKKSFPIIKIYEMQPNVLYSFINKLNRTIKDAAGIYQDAKQSVKIVLEKLQQADKLAFSKNPNEQAKDFQDFANKVLTNVMPSGGDAQKLFNQSLTTFYTSIPGFYTKSYEIPYSGTSVFETKGGTGWVDGSERYFESIFKMVESFLGLETIAYPEFKMSAAMSDRLSFVTKFNLINNNFDNLSKNLKFIHTLYPGVLWGRLGLRAVPSMVYSIEIPGINFCRYSTLELKIKGKGFQKKLPKVLLDKLLTNFGLTSATTTGYFNEQTFFPEIYEVEMTFKSILPYTFEMYADYLVNGKFNETIVGKNIGVLDLTLFH